MGQVIELKQHGNFVEIALNRPEVFNAFDFEMLSELTTVLTRLSMDGSVKGIVLAGRGKAFVPVAILDWPLVFLKNQVLHFIN